MANTTLNQLSTGKTFSSLGAFANQTVPMHDLSPLLTHPDFHQGIVDAQECFLCDYAPAPLSEDQMVALVEKDLGRAATLRGHEMFDGTDLEVANSYFWYLGYVFGIINEGLTYTYTIG